MSALIAIGAFAAMATGVGGIGYAVIKYQQQVAAARERVLDAIAGQYGFSRFGDTVIGQRDGFAFGLRFEYRTRGKSQYPYTSAWAKWSPPLDLGLAVTPVGGVDDIMESIFGRQDIRIGDPGFDNSMNILGDDTARTASVLTPDIRQALRELGTASLVDGQVAYDYAGHIMNVDQLRGLCDRLMHIASRVLAIRSTLPLADALIPYEPAFATFARRFGLTLSRCPLAVWGTIEGCSVIAYALRRAKWDYSMVVNVKFPAPLGVGLTMEAETMWSRMPLIGAKDIELGDEAFDRTFKLNAGNEARVREAFDAPLRGKLRALHDRYPIMVSDDGLVTTLPNLNAVGQIPQIVPQLQEVALELHGKIGGGRRADAAYR
jgi:hypothetical protein